MDTGLTFDEQQEQGRWNLGRLGILERALDRRGLEDEIARFLQKKQCLSLATVNADGSPHQTVLDYVSDRLEIIIASAGGHKFENLATSSRVSIAIGYTDGTVQSEYGLTIDGTAKVYTAPHPKFLGGMLKMKSFLEEWSRAVQPMENIIKRAITARVIRIKPERMLYMNLPDGIILSRWEKG